VGTYQSARQITVASDIRVGFTASSVLSLGKLVGNGWSTRIVKKY